MKSIKLNSLILAFIAALSVILLSTTALAQSDININNSNIIRFGGDVIVPPQQVVENAHAIGGDVTIQEGARVTQTAIAIDGDVILEEGARVDGDAYAVGGEIIISAGATIGGASGTVLENGRWGMHGRRRGTSSFLVRYLLNTAFHLFNVLIGTIIGVFFTGVLILTLIGLIPILGGLVLSVVNIFGFGGLLLWLLNKRRLQAL